MAYRVVVDPDQCKGCLLCVEVCPRGVLRLSSHFNSRALHYIEVCRMEACIGCLGCAEICPDAAIEIRRIEAVASVSPARNRTGLPEEP